MCTCEDKSDARICINCETTVASSPRDQRQNTCRSIGKTQWKTILPLESRVRARSASQRQFCNLRRTVAWRSILTRSRLVRRTLSSAEMEGPCSSRRGIARGRVLDGQPLDHKRGLEDRDHAEARRVIGSHCRASLVGPCKLQVCQGRSDRFQVRLEEAQVLFRWRPFCVCVPPCSGSICYRFLSLRGKR